MFSSKNTTIAGIGALLTAVGAALAAFFDGDPATMVQWATLVPTIIAAVGLITAKDSNK